MKITPIFWLLAGFASTGVLLGKASAEVDILKKECIHRESQRSRFNQELKEVEHAIFNTNHLLVQLRRAYKQAHSELVQVEVVLNKVKHAIDEDHTQLIYLFQARYKTGRSEALRLLLSQQDPYTKVREMGYYRYLTKARQALGIKLRAERLHLSQLAFAVREKQRRLTLLTQEKEKHHKKLLLERQKKQKLLKMLEQDFCTTNLHS